MLLKIRSSGSLNQGHRATGTDVPNAWLTYKGKARYLFLFFLSK